MKGFFESHEFSSTARPDGRIRSCVSCGLFKECKNPKSGVTGKGKKGILNIFEVSSKVEDLNNSFFKSTQYRLLAKKYKEIGIDLFEDCYNVFAIQCYTETPNSKDVDFCRKKVLQTIENIKPKIIITFGILSLTSVLGHRWKKALGGIEKWNTYCIPDQDLKTWVIPTYAVHLITDTSKIECTLFQKDLKRIENTLNTIFPVFKEPEIVYLENDLSVLDTIKSGYTAFDFETTGLKPHDHGHQIVCASVAVSENKVYSFMIPKQGYTPFVDYLKNKSILKIAHNMKFEDTWANVRLKTPVNGWYMDTMQMAHIINNTAGTTGLKFQTYVQFGVIDYSSHISPYLGATDSKNANSLNRVLELCSTVHGKKELLKYCAYDSIFEYRLAMKWKHLLATQGETDLSPIGSDFPNAYALMHKGVLELAKAERNGLCIDLEYCEKQKTILTKKINRIERQLNESKFYKDWLKSAGGTINLNSHTQLRKFLYEIKGFTPKKFTAKNEPSTDEGALKMLNVPGLDMILERSKLQKLRDTYLDGFIREQVNGLIHPFFNLHLVKTYRSSSDSPNFQNIPKRDKLANKIVRSAIKPRPGHHLLEMDFKAVEVAIAACYHKDPTMVKYIVENHDMHGEMAAQIFKIKDFDKRNPEHSLLRGAAKNGFVFPQFYGDYYKNCASNICSSWVKLPETKWKKGQGIEFAGGYLADHFIKNGIKSFQDFTDYIQEIETHFWAKRFPVYSKWKNKHYQKYLKNGYVSLNTGFVCQGIMSKNDAINYPVQGAAFHCLLWTFIELSKWLSENNYKTKLVGQIHDAIVIDVHANELHDVYYKTKQLAEKALVEAFKWINVPLSIEAELCPLDASWNEKHEWNAGTVYYYYHPKTNLLFSSYNENETNVDASLQCISKKQASKLCGQSQIKASIFSYEMSQFGWIHKKIIDDLPF